MNKNGAKFITFVLVVRSPFANVPEPGIGNGEAVAEALALSIRHHYLLWGWLVTSFQGCNKVTVIFLRTYVRFCADFRYGLKGMTWLFAKDHIGAMPRRH